MNPRSRIDALERRGGGTVPGACGVCGHDGGDRPRVYVSQVKADGSPIDWRDPDDLPNPKHDDLRDCPRCRREAIHVIIRYVDRRERRLSL